MGRDSVAQGRWSTCTPERGIAVGYDTHCDHLDSILLGGNSNLNSMNPGELRLASEITGWYSPGLSGHAVASPALTFNAGNGEINYDTSSRRYKENERSLEIRTSDVLSLTPKSFDAKPRTKMEYTQAMCDTEKTRINDEFTTKIENARAQRLKDRLAAVRDRQLAACEKRVALWQAEQGKTGQFGLIAEDVDAIIPSLVHKNKDGQPESVDYLHLSVLLLQVCKEQQTALDDLTARVAALEAL